MADQAEFSDISRDAARATPMKTKKHAGPSSPLDASFGSHEPQPTFKDHHGKICTIKKSGHMRKQSSGLIKKWDRRWFVITDDKTKLLYWVAKENMTQSDQPKGVIDITGCSISEAEERTKKPYSFGLVHATRKPVFFQADTKEEMVGWMKYINYKCLGLNESVSLADFELLALLGKGGFAKVIQVRKKDTNKIYALKVLRKAHVIESKSVESTKTEHNILKTVNHPFIVKMHFAFQTDERLFFVMEFINGGELFTLLQRERRFSVGRMRLYAAEILLALEHLHHMGIIYRDLKPENVLIDSEGHIRLTDFGLSKSCQCEERHYSFVGTPYYMAPEILMKRGHTRTCDWWSLGILSFEMLTGLPPFYHQNPRIACAAIVAHDVEIPAAFPDVVKHFLKGLLTRDPETRLGSAGTDGQEIREHPFFDGIDFDEVLYKQISNDFVPHLQNATDVSNFDSRFTSSNPELSVARDRGDPDEVFKGYEFDYVSPAYRMRNTTITSRPTLGEDEEWDELVRQSVCRPAEETL